MRLVAVTHAWLGEQPAGPGRVRLQLAPQLGHVKTEVAGRVRVSRSPDLGEQLTLAEQLARVAQQHLEQVPLGGGEPDVPTLWGVRGGGAASLTSGGVRGLGTGGATGGATGRAGVAGDALGGGIGK